MKSCAISRRVTVLGRKQWALAVCLVRAAGHRPCSAPLSGMPLGIVVVVVVGVRCRRRHRCRRRRTVRCRYRTAPAVVVAPCLPAVPLAIVARCRRHRHASSSSSSLRRRLAAPRAIVHRRCTVVPLSRRWIRRCRLPPSSTTGKSGP